MNNTRKALQIAALYFILENYGISQKDLLESKSYDLKPSKFPKTNKTQDDIQLENQQVKENKNAS